MSDGTGQAGQYHTMPFGVASSMQRACMGSRQKRQDAGAKKILFLLLGVDSEFGKNRTFTKNKWKHYRLFLNSRAAHYGFEKAEHITVC
ncbi:MAG: hypothetical protein PHI97_26610, partial [Desulfobulbus sp.]|nr:hypothetical protein [Desulfobulbus sp.]